MSTKVIDTIKPAGDFPVAEAHDIDVTGKRLDVVIEELEAETGGTKNYNDLENQPKVNGITLTGNKSTEDLGINIPTKTSQLQNDSNFLTEHQSLAAYAKKSEIPTIPQNISAFQNDAGYLTSHQDISGKADISAVESLSNRVFSTETEQASLSARMDAFTRLNEGSTTGDAELADARVSFNGVEYQNVGSAVRNQITDVRKDLSVFSANTVNELYFDKFANLFDKNSAVLDKTPKRGTGQTMYDFSDTEGGFSSEIYKVEPGDKLTFSTAWITVNYYDASGNFLSYTSANTISHIVPSDAAFMRFSVNQRNQMYFDDLVFTINRDLPEKPIKFHGESVMDACDRIRNYVEKKSPNLFDKNAIEYSKSYRRETGTSSINSTITSETTFISTQLWAVSEGDVIRVSRGWGTYLYYDENGVYIKSVSTADREFVVPSGVSYMRFHYGNQTDHMEDDFMMTINEPMPIKYTPYGYISEVGALDDRLSKVESAIVPNTDKAILILNFDQNLIEGDNRIAIMEQYGWKPSFVGGISPEITKEMLAKGWDLTSYWATSNVPADSQLSENSESALNACKLYVRTALDYYESNGFYNPTAWMCRQGKYGPTLGKALDFYGYKIVRTGHEGAFSRTLNADFTETNVNGIYSDNIEKVKSAIDTAVSNKSAVGVFTHYVVDDISEDRGYDCLKSVYVELMEYIKSLEVQGKLVVMNYREFYASQYPNQSHDNDYNRIIKRLNFIEGSHS